MSSYLEGYGAGDEKRERRTKLILLSLVGAVAVGITGWFLLRDFQEKRRAGEFLDLLRTKQYEAAYRFFGCDPKTPCPRYTYEQFLDDWAKGPHADLSKMTIAGTQHCRNGIIQTLRWGPGDEVPLWVNRGDLQVSFAPWPRCDFSFQMPVQ
jgi:hypothetical protein